MLLFGHLIWAVTCQFWLAEAVRVKPWKVVVKMFSRWGLCCFSRAFMVVSKFETVRVFRCCWYQPSLHCLQYLVKECQLFWNLFVSIQPNVFSDYVFFFFGVCRFQVCLRSLFFFHAERKLKDFKEPVDGERGCISFLPVWDFKLCLSVTESYSPNLAFLCIRIVDSEVWSLKMKLPSIGFGLVHVILFLFI